MPGHERITVRGDRRRESEEELEGELDGAGAAYLVEGLRPPFQTAGAELSASICVDRP
jgi:hypothetical protein